MEDLEVGKIEHYKEDVSAMIAGSSGSQGEAETVNCLSIGLALVDEWLWGMP